MSPKNVSFILGLEDDQICNHLSREFVHGFQALGVQAHLFQLKEGGDIKRFAKHIDQWDCDLVISLAGMGIDRVKEFQHIYERNIPSLTMLLDPSILYWPVVQYPLENNYVACLSQSDVHFVAEHEASKVGCFQLNHAAIEKEVTPWSKKDIGLFYCASLRNSPEETRRSWDSFKPGIAKILNEIVECHMVRQGINLMEDVATVLNCYPSPYDVNIFRNFFSQVDLYFRDFRRVETLSRLIDKTSILLAGPGWDQVIDTTHSNVTYLGRIHPTEVRKYNERSKIVLNVINYYHESHERVFSSMADGAVVLSSNSPFYEKSFTEKEGVFFNWADTGVFDKVNDLLDDDVSLQEMAHAGNQAFLKGHTWKHRAQTVMENIK
ncbi:glycosyltransferase [Terasakiella sp. SH-1]|uniref:glycosyltransferase family protein n=1 Tax=Terasakiella sp. SH-1 TaxID=2560057 RepID=UPI001073D7CE|nr:glycosyltransferase [Terasakiella sp. SH-1]